MKSLQNFFSKKKEYTQKREIVVDEKTVFHIFSQIILAEYGKKGVQAITPSFYRNKIIFIRFGQSLWAQEVWSNRSKIIRKVNEKVGQEILVNIKAH